MITSRQNSLVKEIRSLKDKKNRDDLGLFVAEGVKLTVEALTLLLPVQTVIGTDDGVDKVKDYLLDGVRVETVSKDVFNCLSDEATPQGVLAVIKKPSQKPVSPSESCILLDGVSDPSNVGAIIRTAIASGYKDVYLTDNSADAFSPKAVRSSMGGIFRANVYRGALSELLSLIDFPLIVGDMSGENVFNAKIDKEFCLCLGNEGHGFSPSIKERATKTVKIPMQNGMESLNVAVSAGILMYSLKK